MLKKITLIIAAVTYLSTVANLTSINIVVNNFTNKKVEVTANRKTLTKKAISKQLPPGKSVELESDWWFSRGCIHSINLLVEGFGTYTLNFENKICDVNGKHRLHITTTEMSDSTGKNVTALVATLVRADGRTEKTTFAQDGTIVDQKLLEKGQYIEKTERKA